MKLGIVGLPNVGKSTLFNSLTKAGAESANYPFCTIDPNVGVVPVPDPRLGQLAALYNSAKITPAVIEFVDIAGLVKGASKGELVNRILRARYGHEKEYLVTVDKPIDSEFVRKMSAGVKILDTVTRPCEVEKTGKTSFRIILTQGLNRQIRRMCEALGYQVQTLKRVRMLNITLDGLKTGEYREVTAAERQKLEDILNGKKNG